MTGIYWGWWISLVPFTGMFMAKISKGRTIRSLINFGVILPVLVCFMWITVFGGLAIKMERRAILDACRCQCTTTSDKAPFDNRFCTSVGLNPTGQTALAQYYEGGPHGGEAFAVTPITCQMVRPSVNGGPAGCESIIQLSMLRPERRWFALMGEYMTGGYQAGSQVMGRFLSGVTLTSLVAWLIAVLDTGSFVIDQMMSNGENMPHRLWRITMMATALALTSALLRSGAWGPMYDSATAFQTMSFTMGMICTLLFTALPVCVFKDLRSHERGARRMWTHPVGGGALDLFETAFSLGIHKPPSGQELFRWLKSLVFPYAVLPAAIVRLHKQDSAGRENAMAPVIMSEMLPILWLSASKACTYGCIFCETFPK